MKPAHFASRVLDLLRLRSGPQDLPYSLPLLYRLAILALLVDLVAAWALEVNEASSVRLLVSFALTFALPWLVLRWRGHEARYVQTMLACWAPASRSHCCSCRWRCRRWRTGW